MVLAAIHATLYPQWPQKSLPTLTLPAKVHRYIVSRQMLSPLEPYFIAVEGPFCISENTHDILTKLKSKWNPPEAKKLTIANSISRIYHRSSC